MTIRKADKNEFRFSTCQSCIFLLILILIVSQFEGCARRCTPYIKITGEVKPEITGDTLNVNYFIRPTTSLFTKLNIDSAFFRLCSMDSMSSNKIDSLLANDSLIYIKSKDDTCINENRILKKDSSRSSYRGKLRYFINKKLMPDGYSVICYHSFKNICNDRTVDTIYESPCYGFKPACNSYVLMAIGLGGSINTSVSENLQMASSYGLYSVELGYIRNLSPFQLDLTFRINDAFKKRSPFTFYNYGNLGVRFKMGDNKSFSPSIYLSGKYSRLKWETESVKYVNKGFGGEFGMAFETKFERFSYSYSTNIGGYHRFDLLFAFSSNPTGGKVGTMYSVYYGNDMKMIQVKFGGIIGSVDDSILEYYNNRPLLFKLLALLSLSPLLIFALLFPV